MAQTSLDVVLAGLVKEGRLEEAQNGPVCLYRLPGRPHYWSKEQIAELIQSKEKLS
jgi:hypothetical protein